MVIRQRAIQAEDKQERYRAILDAAERLLMRSPDRVANVAEVAAEAGLAKGTVYLYFPSKDELLLALHERDVDGFFGALNALLDRRAPITIDDVLAITIDDVLAITREHMVKPPLFLLLASRCFGAMEQSLPVDAASAFKRRMAERLERAGVGLERHFPQLKRGGGGVLLRHSYALMLGLWQMAGATRMSYRTGRAGAPSPILAFSDPDELEHALRALWMGTIGGAIRAV